MVSCYIWKGVDIKNDSYFLPHLSPLVCVLWLTNVTKWKWEREGRVACEGEFVQIYSQRAGKLLRLPRFCINSKDSRRSNLDLGISENVK